MSGNVIDRAIDRLARGGLNQDGTYGDMSQDDTPLCIIGALKAVGEDNAQYSLPRDLIRQEVRAECDNPKMFIPTWNDDPGTSLEDVLLVMKRASARLDEAQSA